MVWLCICFGSVHTYLAVKIMYNDLKLMKAFPWSHRETSLCAMAYSQQRSWDLEVKDPILRSDLICRVMSLQVYMYLFCGKMHITRVTTFYVKVHGSVV